MGRNFDDYSQWTLSASVAPTPRAVFTPDLTLLLQGEGDIRKPMPPYPAPDYPFLFVGTVERTLRVGSAARIWLFDKLDIDANAGIHFVSNRMNVPGASATRFVGSVAFRYRWGGEFK